MGLVAEPGHLPLGLVAMSLFRGGDSLLVREFSAQVLQRLLQAEGVYRSHGARVAESLQQQFRLLDQAVVEHLSSALIDTVVKLLARRIQSNAQDVEAAQGIAPALLPEFTHWRASCHANFDGADELWPIVGMNLGGGRGIETAQ